MSSSDYSSSSDSDLEELVSKAYSKISSRLKNNSKASKRTTRSQTKKSEVEHDVAKVDVGSNETNEIDALFVIDKERGSSKFIITNDPEQLSPVREKDSENEIVKNWEEIDKSGRLKEETNKNTKDKKKQKSEKHKNFQLTSSIQSSLSINDTYFKSVPSSSKQSGFDTVISGSSSDNTILKKSVLTPDLERKDSIPAYEEILKQKRLQKRKDRTMTKGKNWFDMKAPEMTEEQRNDLMVLKMRKALDPKRFYKSNDIKALPKFFQFGRVIESPADFYHSRIPKKQRKATMVEELLADAEFRKYNKRKYEAIQEARMNKKGPYQRTASLSKKKKPSKDSAFRKRNKKSKK